MNHWVLWMAANITLSTGIAAEDFSCGWAAKQLEKDKQ